MRNPLQDQLLKAGLVKKSKVDQVAREQARQRHARLPDAPDAGAEARRLQAERAERDRALEATRKAEAQQRELRLQGHQIIQAHRLACEGDIAYRFTDEGLIRSLWVDAATRRRLASGALVIVRDEDGHAIVPREVAAKLRERAPELIVLDHASGAAEPPDAEEAELYRRFPVPDDLIW
ncbi:DUF2058 domain-containing protein [Dokdonella sp.]|uniref:DUF2058 domain-containing protein n=1 Tax=Dokdonella sp. TaxID=2291710 RepID=UPI0031BCAAAB|nr:DUF2058 domain-containing protein [Dokdonella sp.]